MSLRTSLQSRTPSALWTGLSLINITMKLCAPLMCVPCSLMYRLMKQFKFVSISSNHLPEPPRLPLPALKTLFEFATKISHFIFDGQYYDQVDGVAMGSPLGPVLANIFMCHFEEQWVNNTVACPSIWFRYVDDTFSLFDNKDKASNFLHYLNNRHPNIKFTMELEENQEIPFLDVLIKRHQNAFSNSTPQKDFHRSLHQVGFFHTKKVLSQFNPHPHLSLFR